MIPNRGDAHVMLVRPLRARGRARRLSAGAHRARGLRGGGRGGRLGGGAKRAGDRRQPY